GQQIPESFRMSSSAVILILERVLPRVVYGVLAGGHAKSWQVLKSVPAQAPDILRLSSASRRLVSSFCGSPPAPFVATRWPLGLSRASIRIHLLLPVDRSRGG